MVREGAYGAVRVMRGLHAGRVGYYDDEADVPGQAVVYFGEPFTDGYYAIWRKWLEPVDVAHYGVERFRRKYPTIAQLVL